MQSAPRVAERTVVGGLAPPVVGVDAVAGVLVEALDGRRQPGGIDAAHVGEVGERPRLLQVAALQQLLREVPRVRSLVGVALAVAVVEDQPRRHGLGGLVAGVHRLADLHVGVRLVDEPVAGGVDHDRPRPLPGLVEGRLAEAAGARVRQPPRLVHQVGRRAESDRGEQRLAGVAGVGDRPSGLVRLVAAVLLAHLRVVGEPAGGDEHAVPGAHRHRHCRRARCAPRRRGRPPRRGRRAAPRSRPGCPGRARRAASGRSATPRSSAAPAAGPWRRTCGSRRAPRRRSSAALRL